MKRILGKSNIEVSAMGLGCWAIGGLFYMDGKANGYGTSDDSISKQAIQKAVDLGINFFDTSDVYGTGHSEEILGEALKGIRHTVVLGTKFGYMYNSETHHVIGENVSKKYIHWALNKSLTRLKTDYIDLYTLHVGNVQKEDLFSVIDTLNELKKAGSIRAYAWSSSNVTLLKEFVQHSDGDAIMHPTNVFTYSQDILNLCEANQFASINIFPLAMGMLSGKYNINSQLPSNEVRGSGYSWVKYFKDGKPVPEYLNKINAIKEILTSNGRSLVQGSLAWIWAKSSSNIPIPGFKTLHQVTENAKAMEYGPLTTEQMNEIDSILTIC